MTILYYLYEIKNNINGKIYVGVHQSTNTDDGYMGSGIAISAAIRKYGIENFTKAILETFLSDAEMYAREKEIVNEEFLNRDDVYNLTLGGHGGFNHINRNKDAEYYKTRSCAGSTQEGDQRLCIAKERRMRRAKIPSIPYCTGSSCHRFPKPVIRPATTALTWNVP